MKTIEIFGDDRYPEYTKISEGCRGILVCEGKILLSYLREYDRWLIPGGHLEAGEILAGVATDEHDPDREIDKLALSLEYALENKYVMPQNFWGIGGMKIFRDLIYLMQGMMRADHKFYKKGGYYKDFPQKHKGTILKMYLVGLLLSNDKIKAKMGNKMNEGMLMPYNKMFEEMDKKAK